MKVLSVVSSLDPATGGPAMAIKLIYSGMQKLGHIAHSVCLDDPRSYWLRDIDFPVDTIGPTYLSYRYCPSLPGYLRVTLPSCDAVVVHGLWQHNSFATWRMARQLGVPFYVFSHGMLDPWFKRRYPLKHLKKWLYWPWAQYRILRDAAAVFFTCDEERRLARQSFWLYRANEIVTGYGTLAPPNMNEDGQIFFDEFPELKGRKILLFLGRLHPKKNLEILIRAFGGLALRQRNLALVIAGPLEGAGASAPYVSVLKKAASATAPDCTITFTGMLEGERKWAALRSCDALVLPSFQENFGIVVAEALACSRPVLISNGVNIWREIEDSGAGFVAAPDEAGIRSLLDRWAVMDEQAWITMRTRAFDCYERHFKVEGVVARMAGAIEKTLATSGRSRILTPSQSR